VPHTEKIIKTCTLGGGITATVSDLTSHYFGGYYHVRIRIRAEVPVAEAAFSDQPEYRDALRRLGSCAGFSRTLEKMAVAEGEIELVRQQLLASFDMNMLPYLQRDNFCNSFVQSEYRKILKSRPAGKWQPQL
jgi:hypothetical protein